MFSFYVSVWVFCCCFVLFVCLFSFYVSFACSHSCLKLRGCFRAENSSIFCDAQNFFSLISLRKVSRKPKKITQRGVTVVFIFSRYQKIPPDNTCNLGNCSSLVHLNFIQNGAASRVFVLNSRLWLPYLHIVCVQSCCCCFLDVFVCLFLPLGKRRGGGGRLIWSLLFSILSANCDSWIYYNHQHLRQHQHQHHHYYYFITRK